MDDLRCKGCRRRVAFTTRTQAVPVQCDDPWCELQMPVTANEERDSLMTYLVLVERVPVVTVADAFGITRQGAARAIASR